MPKVLAEERVAVTATDSTWGDLKSCPYSGVMLEASLNVVLEELYPARDPDRIASRGRIGVSADSTPLVGVRKRFKSSIHNIQSYLEIGWCFGFVIRKVIMWRRLSAPVLVPLLVILVSPAAASEFAPGSLAAAAKTAGIHAGAAIDYDLNTARFEIAAREFTSATLENSLKWQNIM